MVGFCAGVLGRLGAHPHTPQPHTAHAVCVRTSECSSHSVLRHTPRGYPRPPRHSRQRICAYSYSDLRSAFFTLQQSHFSDLTFLSDTAGLRRIRTTTALRLASTKQLIIKLSSIHSFNKFYITSWRVPWRSSLSRLSSPLSLCSPRFSVIVLGIVQDVSRVPIV